MQRTAYRNPAFDAILDEAVGVYDASKAASLYRKALEIMVPDAPIVLQVAETLLYGINKDVRNFQTRPDAESRVRDLWLDR
jgi:ABC-type transport system substrate-binding protein